MIGRGWKVHIEHMWATDTARVWVYDAEAGGATRYLVNEGNTYREEVRRGGELGDGLEFIEIPTHLLAAIVAAGADHMPPDRAQATHLADAMKVRDRLLVMLEKAADT